MPLSRPYWMTCAGFPERIAQMCYPVMFCVVEEACDAGGVFVSRIGTGCKQVYIVYGMYNETLLEIKGRISRVIQFWSSFKQNPQQIRNGSWEFTS